MYIGIGTLLLIIILIIIFTCRRAPSRNARRPAEAGLLRLARGRGGAVCFAPRPRRGGPVRLPARDLAVRCERRSCARARRAPARLRPRPARRGVRAARR